MTTEEFFNTWNNKPLDFDHAYGNQCMDVFEQYNQDVVHAPVVYGNAVDVWTKYDTQAYDKFENTLDNFPLEGDVVVWGFTVGQYGHVAICKVGTTQSFTSFDENWPIQVDANGNGTGVCHFQQHDYNGVLGWLHPKSLPAPAPVPPTITDQTILPINNENGQPMELQAVRGELYDRRTAVVNLTNQLTQSTAELDKAQTDILRLNTIVSTSKLEIHDSNSVWIKLYSYFHQ